MPVVERCERSRLESLNGVHVLLVEPDARSEVLIRAVLDYCGALTTVATTVDGAIRVMRQIRADVVVVDTDPEEARVLLSRVRMMEPQAGSTVAVVALSGHSRDGEAHLAGFDGVISKPLSSRDLCGLLSSLTLS